MTNTTKTKSIKKKEEELEEEVEGAIDIYKREPRSASKIQTLASRLSRVSGQINGVKNMLYDNRYCTDILIQLLACQKALRAVALMVFEEHIETCVTEKIKAGDKHIVAETVDVFKRML